MLTWKSATGFGVGMLDRDELELMKYSSYEPNAVDKMFFKISRLVFHTTWIAIAINLILVGLINQGGGSVRPIFEYMVLPIVFITLPGLSGSVYLCKVTGSKLLKIDIGFRLVILFIFLFSYIVQIVNLFATYYNP